eukprot:3370827-Amphidinium_carterae.1
MSASSLAAWIASQYAFLAQVQRLTSGQRGSIVLSHLFARSRRMADVFIDGTGVLIADGHVDADEDMMQVDGGRIASLLVGAVGMPQLMPQPMNPTLKVPS